MVEMKKCTGLCERILELNKVNFKWRTDSNKWRGQCRDCERKGIPDHIIIENNKQYQICTGECQRKLEICDDNFSLRRCKNIFERQCKDCIKKYKKQYREENKEETAAYMRQYWEENKDKIKEYQTQYYQENKEEINETKKRYYEKNDKQIKEYQKEYREANKEKIKKHKTQYYQENKDEILEKQKEYNSQPEIKKKINENQIKRRQANQQQKIHHNVSCSINNAIKRSSGIKGGSILDFLPYKISELMEYLMNHPEKEEWMTWNNYGKYDKNNKYDPNDKLIWRWHIDHIIPHSSFRYISMKDEEFKRCWSLDNLRPLEGMKNIKKGNKY